MYILKKKGEKMGKLYYIKFFVDVLFASTGFTLIVVLAAKFGNEFSF